MTGTGRLLRKSTCIPLNYARTPNLLIVATAFTQRSLAEPIWHKQRWGGECGNWIQLTVGCPSKGSRLSTIKAEITKLSLRESLVHGLAPRCLVFLLLAWGRI